MREFVGKYAIPGNEESMQPRQYDLGLQTSIEDSNYLRDVFRFPKELKGLRILSLGSGIPSSFPDLRRRGAIPTGVDIRYPDVDSLIESSDAFLQDLSLIHI